jgi:hypothetical protein
MSKAYVVCDKQSKPLKVFLLPDVHTVNHYTAQVQKAIKAAGLTGSLVDVDYRGAPEIADVINSGKLNHL